MLGAPGAEAAVSIGGSHEKTHLGTEGRAEQGTVRSCDPFITWLSAPDSLNWMCAEFKTGLVKQWRASKT